MAKVFWIMHMHITIKCRLNFLCAKLNTVIFVVCTFPEGQHEPSIHIERIVPDEGFWSSCVEKSSDFFVFCLRLWEDGTHEVQFKYQKPPKCSTSDYPTSSSVHCTSLLLLQET